MEGQGLRVALVASRFNERVTSKLVEGAERCLARHGCEERTVYQVPGAWEIPPVVRRLCGSSEIDGVVALGALIRGETPHFDVLAASVSQALAQIALDSRVPVIFGVLTTDTAAQAIERSQDNERNKGWEAARCVVEMINLYRRMA